MANGLASRKSPVEGATLEVSVDALGADQTLSASSGTDFVSWQGNKLISSVVLMLYSRAERGEVSGQSSRSDIYDVYEGFRLKG